MGRLRSNWAQTWNVGRHWRLEIEWVYLARYFTVSLWDSRREAS